MARKMPRGMMEGSPREEAMDRKMAKKSGVSKSKFERSSRDAKQDRGKPTPKRKS